MKQIVKSKNYVLRQLSYAVVGFIFLLPMILNIGAKAANDPTGGLTYSWLDHDTIQDSSGTLWVLNGSIGSSAKYVSKGTAASGCQGNYIQFGGSTGSITADTNLINAVARKQGTVITFGSSSSSTNTGCQQSSKVVTINNPIGHNMQYIWADKNTIKRLAGYDETPAMTYVRDGTTSTFIEQTGSECKDSITIGSNNSSGSFVGRAQKAASPPRNQDVSWTQDASKLTGAIAEHWYESANIADGSNCYKTKPVGLAIMRQQNATLTPEQVAAGAGIADNGTGNGQDGGESIEDACSSNINFFGWLLCPMLGLADGIFGFLRDSIYSLLAVPELSGSSSESLNSSWAAIRNIANVLLVLVALFMIVSQIFNFNFVDAYTVKKVLPRLVIAAILIQLSWFICSVLIQIFNALGYGLNNLITAPFSSDSLSITNIIGSSSDSAQTAAGVFTQTGVVIGGAAIALTALAPGGMLTIALVAIGVIISILVVIFTLVVRKLLLIALVVLAPIAFVAWILPNTQKFWNSWWNLFIKLLIMFPLIALLFAAGQIFAKITVATDPENPLNNVIAIIAYFAPLFLVPATFKFAGGIFASITGVLNNASGKVKQSGFGLRRRRDAYRKVRDEIKGNELNSKSREAAAKALDPNANRFQRMRGRAAVGGMALVPGKKGNAALSKYQRIYSSQADEQAIRDAKLEFGTAIAGMAFDNKSSDPAHLSQVKSATALASAKEGEKVNINGRDVVANRALSRVASGWLADANRSDALRQVQANLESQGAGGSELWNTIQGENAGKIAGMNPDQVKKSWEKLDAAQMAGMDEASWRNMRAQMATWESERQTALNSGKLADAQTITDRLNTVMATANAAMTGEATKSQVQGGKLAHARAITSGPSGWGRTMDSNGRQIDFAGRSPGETGYDAARGHI